MKKTTKMMTAMMSLALPLLLLGACKNNNASQKVAKNDAKEVTKIGVLQVVEHPSLTAAYKGFQEALKEAGYEEGKNLELDYLNAQNAQDNLKSMSEKLIREKSDLLLAIGTPSAQSLLNETKDIPILVTAVTDLKAANLVESNEKPGGNLTGTSDMVSIPKQMDLLHTLVPDAKTIGLIYNAGEANSKVQGDEAEKAIDKLGLKVKRVTINSTNDVKQALDSLGDKVDGVYVPTDNTMAASAALIEEYSKTYKKPVVTGWAQGDTGSVATIGIDYEALGKQTGEMAVSILKGEKKPQDLPIETLKDLQLVTNEDLAKEIGIDLSVLKDYK